jgi:hypothetical protein
MDALLLTLAVVALSAIFFFLRPSKDAYSNAPASKTVNKPVDAAITAPPTAAAPGPISAANTADAETKAFQAKKKEEAKAAKEKAKAEAAELAVAEAAERAAKEQAEAAERIAKQQEEAAVKAAAVKAKLAVLAKANANKPLQEFTLPVLGFEKVGKTSLCKRWATGEFSRKDDYVPTRTEEPVVYDSLCRRFSDDADISRMSALT